MESTDRKIHCEILKHIATLSIDENGWTKEINIVSWNDKEPQYDIRSWNPDHEYTSRGATMTESELILLRDVLNLIDFK